MSGSYWCGDGKYQTKADELQKLIPKYGPCNNVFIEQFRIIRKIYYGLNNNGDFSINNGDYHQDYTNNKDLYNIQIPEDIIDFIDYMKDLEDYYNQIGDYTEIEYNENYDSDNEYNPYLKNMSYNRQLIYLENIMNSSILFAYKFAYKNVISN
jgi:hypothetical protein